MAKISLLPECLAGFNAADGTKNPHLWSSACWFAWQAGAFLQRTGGVAPRSCSMGRGYQVNVNDMVIAFDRNMAPWRYQ